MWLEAVKEGLAILEQEQLNVQVQPPRQTLQAPQQMPFPKLQHIHNQARVNMFGYIGTVQYMRSEYRKFIAVGGGVRVRSTYVWTEGMGVGFFPRGNIMSMY